MITANSFKKVRKIDQYVPDEKIPSASGINQITGFAVARSQTEKKIKQFITVHSLFKKLIFFKKFNFSYLLMPPNRMEMLDLFGKCRKLVVM